MVIPPDYPEQLDHPDEGSQSRSWIQTLARSVSRLSEHQLLSLASVLRSSPASSLTSARLQRLLAIPTAEASQLAKHLETVFADREGIRSELGDVAVALEALALGRFDKKRTAAAIEIVCTAPFRLGVPVRSTFATALEMVREAKEEIFVEVTE